MHHQMGFLQPNMAWNDMILLQLALARTFTMVHRGSLAFDGGFVILESEDTATGS